MNAPLRAITASTAVACLFLLTPAAAWSQERGPRASDLVTPEALIKAAYESIQRRPGENFDWDRFESLFLPGAVMLPNTEQTEGESRRMSPQAYTAWIDAWTQENFPIGGPEDRGFREEEIGRRIERYGDIAQAMSVYERHYWDDDEVLGRGINSFQMALVDGRWRIVSIVWDEDYAAGPIPPDYLR